MSEQKNELIRLPLLALRGLNVFPGMLLTFDVERAASLGALSAAAKRDQMIFLAAQKDLTVDLPEAEDIYRVGTVCRIRQQLRQPQGGMCRVMVEGLYRAESLGVHTDPKGYSALVRALPEKEEHPGAARTEALLDPDAVLPPGKRGAARHGLFEECAPSGMPRRRPRAARRVPVRGQERRTGPR